LTGLDPGATIRIYLGNLTVLSIQIQQLRRIVAGLASPALFVLTWTILSERSKNFFLPSPLTVLDSFGIWVFGDNADESLLQGTMFVGDWSTNVLASALRASIGFSIAAIIGIPLGILLGRSRIAALCIDPLIQLLRPIPITAWLPFAIVLFGVRDNSAYFLIALGCFFPIVVNTSDGARQTSRTLVRAAQSLGASKGTVFRRVALPGSLPFIFTGLRISVGLAWVLVVVSELLAVQSGLGFSMWTAYQQFRTDIIVCCMISVGALGFLSDLAVMYVRNKLTAWALYE